MSVTAIDRIGDVKIYGNGHFGGKGAGLIKINECYIPRAHKLRTRILTTTFYDRFRNLGGKFGEEELETLASILNKLGNIPISVRSSATDEGCVLPGGKSSVHAGENTSFMLPNNHPHFPTRFNQFIQAIFFIYRDFISLQPANSKEKMAIVINPIPGIHIKTPAGPTYTPLVSGVANSFFVHALKTQNPEEGIARIAFGHGYATVLDDFPVISMATIKNPLPLSLLGKGQKYFYAINMNNNERLEGEELETMSKLHIRLADRKHTKILGISKNLVTFEELVQHDHFNFRKDLLECMEIISSKISSHFQIEFTFNIDFEKEKEEHGIFHIVQLTELPEMKWRSIQIPEQANHIYLSTQNLQGHGIIHGINSAVIVSPFIYSKTQHDSVSRKISEINTRMLEREEKYILIVPGRLGSRNINWGIYADYKDVDGAVAIFEYGVDIAGRAEPISDEANMSGGIYGSHFLYMIQGGYDEEQKRIQTRMYGTQGTHFLTNIAGNNVIYSYITPSKDKIDPWFFSPPDNSEAIYVKQFPQKATIYADSAKQKCIVMSKG
ncbi:MAG: hypothetical protein MUP98_19575 [Candidatus Aminicenantes bacterium]|nr:hypothetical protein [Candidatus Aminicenantes bacterium]